MAFRVESDFETKGLRCVVVMTGMGHRCGYVGLSEGHPLYQKTYEDLYAEFDLDIEVHGGITWSEGGNGSKYPVESDLWWFGYDCNHSGDAQDLNEMAPEQQMVYREYRLLFPSPGVIRSLDFCKAECILLANQLAELKRRPSNGTDIGV